MCVVSAPAVDLSLELSIALVRVQVEEYEGRVDFKGVCGACAEEWESVACGGTVVYTTLRVEARWTPPPSSGRTTTTSDDSDALARRASSHDHGCESKSVDEAGAKAIAKGAHRADGADSFVGGYTVRFTLRPSTDCANFINEFAGTPVWSTENLARPWTTPSLRSISEFTQWCFRAFTPLVRACKRVRDVA